MNPSAWREFGIGIHRFGKSGTASDVPNGMLVQRRAWELRVREREQPSVFPHARPDHAVDIARQPPPDGVLFGGRSRVYSTDSIELMIHRGWTIYVGRDITDGDWCAMAKPAVLASVQEFLNDRKNEPWVGKFVASRELAVSQARTYVDVICDEKHEADEPQRSR